MAKVFDFVKEEAEAQRQGHQEAVLEQLKAIREGIQAQNALLAGFLMRGAA